MKGNDSIFVSAGDPSADFPGKELIREIKRDCPEINFYGFGGPEMQAAGLSPLADYRQMAVMGFWEVIPRYFYFRSLINKAATAITASRPKAVILMDYPGFNLRLARKVKPMGIPIIYYISPQVWAWGKGRIDTIRELVDLMLVIFPFEVEFYRSHGIEACYTGHPVVDRFADVPDRETCRQEIGVEPATSLIALLPGSRPVEIKRMLPAMAKAAITIRSDLPEAKFMVAGIADIGADFYRRIIGRRKIDIVIGKTPQLLNASDLVVTSSGTATIEAAYFARPMVVVYKTGFLTYRIARRLITLDAVGMVNIVAGEKIVPELLQGQARPSTIASEAMAILESKAEYERMTKDLKLVREKLGTGNAAANAYQAIRKTVTIC